MANTAVYIRPQTNTKLVPEELHPAECSSGGAVIVAGNFIHADLKTALPRLHKNILTRDTNILVQVYTNISGVYKAACWLRGWPKGT